MICKVNSNICTVKIVCNKNISFGDFVEIGNVIKIAKKKRLCPIDH